MMIDLILTYDCRDKKRANQENKLLMKQLERNRRESEKEKASMHNELQRETQPNANVIIFALLCVLYI